MNPELREAIGRALYEASFDFSDDDMPTWDELDESTWIKKETWMARAEKVVSTFLAHVRDNYEHPETGLTKQEMVHYRRGETEARMWHFNNKGATKEEFELAGKMWIRHSKSAEHVQELILKGWMSVWKD